MRIDMGILKKTIRWNVINLWVYSVWSATPWLTRRVDTWPILRVLEKKKLLKKRFSRTLKKTYDRYSNNLILINSYSHIGLRSEPNDSLKVDEPFSRFTKKTSRFASIHKLQKSHHDGKRQFFELPAPAWFEFYEANFFFLFSRPAVSAGNLNYSTYLYIIYTLVFPSGVPDWYINLNYSE